MDKEVVIGLVKLQSMPLVNTSIGPQPEKGSMKELWDYCILSLNLSLKTVSPEDGQVGNQKVDGSWTGVIGMLQKNVVQIAFGSIAQTETRSTVGKFSSTFTSSHRHFLVGRHPHTKSPNKSPINFSFLQTVESNVYFWLLCSILLVALVSWIISYLKVTEKKMGFLNHLWLVWEILLGKSNLQTPTNPASRCLFYTWMMCSLVVLSAFGGVLVSKFSVTPSHKFISSMSDFAKYPQVYPVFTAGKAEVEIVKNSQNSVLKDLWHRSQNRLKQSVKTDQDILNSSFTKTLLRRLDNGIVAFGASEEIFKCLLLQREKRTPCQFRKTQHFAYTHGALLFSKTLPNALVKIINYRVSRVSHSHLVQRKMSDLASSENYRRCLEEKVEKEFRSLTLYAYLGAFTLWFIGLSVPLLLLFVEIRFKLSFSLKEKRKYVYFYY